MAQSNAALVEEGAAAAESLKDQAVKLHALVSKYRVAGQSRSSGYSSSGSQAAAPKPAHHAAPAVSHAKPAAKAAAPYAAPAPAASRPAPAPKAPPPPAPATSGNDNEWETF
jgi:methyl-accepting chemotaxis protein